MTIWSRGTDGAAVHTHGRAGIDERVNDRGIGASA